MKKYRNKIALILVLALTLAVAIPVLAQNTVITGAYEDPEIAVLIPTAGEAVINPYKLPVKVTADEPDEANPLAAMGSTTQIATRPLVGVNLGQIPLRIGAKISADTTGDFIFSETAPTNKIKTKTGMVYFQLKNPTEIDSSYSFSCDVEVDAATNEKTLKVDGTTVCNGIAYAGVKTALEGWTATYNKATDLLVGYATAEKAEMIVIKEADAATGDPQNTAGSDSYFVARLAGDVVTLPTEEWLESDGFNATITWVIQPADSTAASGTITP